jgi:hypothetical protein
MAFQYPTNVTDLASYLRYQNIVTGSVFGILILIAIFIIVFIRLKDYPLAKAYGSAAFISAITAIIFRTLQLVNDLVLLFAIFILVTAIIALRFEE